jgi:outer membrane protein assembly factor BamB
MHSAPQKAQNLQGQQGAADSAPLDWPEFHLDASRDGNQSLDTQLSKSNAGSLVPVSGPAFTTTGAATSSPAVYQGILYYTTNTPEGNLRLSTIYAVDAMTGETIWSEPFPNCGKDTKQTYSFSSPAVTTGLVNGVATTELFVGRGGTGPHGCVYDLDGQTGAVIWTYRTSQAVESSPAIMSSNSGTIVVVGDNYDFVHAFSVNYTGSIGGHARPIWNFNNRHDPPPPGYCLNSKNCGDSVWSSPAEGQVMVNGTLHHYAYFGVGASVDHIVGRVDAIDMDTIINNSPLLAWSFWEPNPQPNNDFGSVLVYTDQSGLSSRVFSGTDNGDMYGLDAASGIVYFDFNTSAQLGNIQSTIHSTGALVNLNGTLELIFGSGCSPDIYNSTCNGPNNGHVWAIDALSTNSSGTVIWQSQDFGGDMVSSPDVVNEGADAVIFILGPWYPGTPARGDLLALDPATGSIVGDYQVFNQAYGALSTPAIYGGRIYVTEGYNIYSRHNPGGGGLASFRCATCS